MGRVYNAASGTRTFTLPLSPDISSLERDVCPLGCISTSSPPPPLSRHSSHVCVCVCSGPILIHTLNHTYTHTHTHTYTRTMMREAEIERFPKRNNGYPPGKTQANTKNVPTVCSAPGSNLQTADRLTVLFLGPYGLEYIFLSLSLFSLPLFLSFYISPSEINKIW